MTTSNLTKGRHSMKWTSTLAAVSCGLVLLAMPRPASAYYHPASGRFMERDPVQYNQGMNLYQYQGSSSVNARDWNGRECTPWKPVDQSPPTPEVKWFEEIDNKPVEGFWAQLFSGGSTPEWREFDYQIQVTFRYEKTLAVAGVVNGEHAHAELSYEDEKEDFVFPKYSILEEIQRRKATGIGVRCRKYYLWRKKCKRCCPPERPQIHFWMRSTTPWKGLETADRVYDPGGDSPGWVEGTMRYDGVSPIGGYCHVTPPAGGPSAKTVCKNGGEPPHPHRFPPGP